MTLPVGRLIEHLMPVADVVERHEALVRAPADIVFDTACNFNVRSPPIL